MKQYFLYTTFALGLYFSLTAHTARVQSNGAPIGSTAAPGELSCGRVGCHVGVNANNNINSGPGGMNISADGDISAYTPNQIYNITVSVHQDSLERFGFSLTALKADSTAIGTLIVSDPSKTQRLQGVQQYAAKNYITYTASGTLSPTVGQHSWSFQWQAPAQYEGPVTFYAATVAANNDGTDNGDWVYTTAYNGLQNNSIKVDNNSSALNVFPNPIDDHFFITNAATYSGHTKITLHHLNGAIAAELFEGESIPQPISLNQFNLAAGIYLLSVQNAAKNSTTQIFTKK